MACNDEISIGVWLGNEDGSPAAGLIGSEAAVPLIIKALNEIYPSGLPQWKGSENLCEKEVCAVSGVRPAGNCRTILSRVAKDLPLAVCRSCNIYSEKKKMAVLSPSEGVYRSVDKVRLELKSSSEGHWFINGEYKGKGDMWCSFGKGTYILKCISGTEAESVKITIQ